MMGVPREESKGGAGRTKGRERTNEREGKCEMERMERMEKRKRKALALAAATLFGFCGFLQRHAVGLGRLGLLQ